MFRSGWKFNQLDCFNSNWWQKSPPFRQNFVCWFGIVPKHFDQLTPKPCPTCNMGCAKRQTSLPISGKQSSTNHL